jgi:hypothetical protein
VEAGSTINESERAILNQSITYVKTLNAGYKLAFGDTRSIFNYGASSVEKRAFRPLFHLDGGDLEDSR